MFVRLPPGLPIPVVFCRSWRGQPIANVALPGAYLLSLGAIGVPRVYWLLLLSAA
jgi:hypothetical protein